VRKLRILGFLACASIGLASQSGAETIYAVTTTNVLLSFDSATPATVTTIGPITGLQAGENILAIDLRPATGQLYGLGSSSRLYTINPTTAAASPVGAAGAFTLVMAAQFGFDFNPITDEIRVVSSTLGQNIRLDPDTGALVNADPALGYVTGDPGFGTNPSVTASAYANNFSGTLLTGLYGLEVSRDSLVIQAGIAQNALTTVGPLGFSFIGFHGFDISGLTNIGYVSLQTPSPSLLWNFYTINLGTGALNLVGTIATGGPAIGIRGITVAGQGGGVSPTPTPTSTATATPTATATATRTPTPTPTITTTLSGGGSAAVVPTLSGWAMLTMGLILAAGALLFIRGGSSPGA
jgi:hypothetical protein